jgi:Uma2 family endonuclease
MATLVPLDEYLQKIYKPDMEYVGGVPTERNAGTQLHSMLQFIVAAHLHELGTQFRFTAFMGVRLRMGDSGRYYVPDVMVVEKPFKRGDFVTDIPAAVFEINSTDDTFDRVFEKCLDSASLGAPNIVVLDPDRQRVYAFANRALHLVTSVVLHLPKRSADLPLPVDEMFAELTL